MPNYYRKAGKNPNTTEPNQASSKKVRKKRKHAPKFDKYRWAVNRHIDAQGWASNHSIGLRKDQRLLDQICINDYHGYKTCSLGAPSAYTGNVSAQRALGFFKRYCAFRNIELSKAGESIEVDGKTVWASKYTAKSFLDSPEWRRVRLMVLKRDGARCACCGATAADGERMTVDHIKPRLLYPQLALSMDNLQVLCWPCNQGKGNWDMTDWRKTVSSC